MQRIHENDGQNSQGWNHIRSSKSTHKYCGFVISVSRRLCNDASVLLLLGLGLLLRPAQANAQNAYVANNYDHTISVINTATDKVTATIPAGQQPWGVALTPDGKKLFVTNHRATGIGVSVSSEVAVIDTATNAIIATVPLTNTVGAANGLAVAPDGGTVYVASGMNTNPEGNTVTAIDANTNEITATLRIPIDPHSGASHPYTLAFSPGGEKLYVTHRYGDSLSVIDTASMQLENTILLGSGRQSSAGDDAIAVTPDGSKIYVGGYYGDLAVVDAATGSVAFPGVVPAGLQIAALAMTPDGSRLIVASERSAAYTIDTKAGTILRSGGISPNGRTLFLGALPAEIAVTSDGRKAYMTNRDGNSVSVVDIAKNAVIGTIPVGGHPIGIAIQKVPEKPTEPAARQSR
jgi:YVTN family beta-propeller protein